MWQEPLQLLFELATMLTVKLFKLPTFEKKFGEFRKSEVFCENKLKFSFSKIPVSGFELFLWIYVYIYLHYKHNNI